MPSFSQKNIFMMTALLIILISSVLAFNPLKVPQAPENSTKTNQTNNETNQTQIIVTPTPNPSTTPYTILNKQIPPNYTMGNPIDIDLLNGMTVIFIKKQNQRASIRFTAQRSGEVEAITINALATEGKPKILFGLQEDSNGLPSGEWISETGTVQIRNQGFKTIKLNGTTNLTEGRVYHIVIEPAEDPLNGTAAVVTYRANYHAQPFNHEDPDIPWQDSRINTLSFNGAKWIDENLWPIYVIGYVDGGFEGQPYSLAAPWVVFGSTYVGQTIIPSSDYRIGKIAFDVSLKGREPDDNLYFQVTDEENNVLANGVFAEANQLTTWQTWVEVSLNSSILLEAGHIYRVCLYSPGAKLQTAYHLYGHEFCFQKTIGFGSLQHQLVTSHNGGKGWEENSDADAIFKLTTTD